MSVYGSQVCHASTTMACYNQIQLTNERLNYEDHGVSRAWQPTFMITMPHVSNLEQ